MYEEFKKTQRDQQKKFKGKRPKNVNSVSTRQKVTAVISSEAQLQQRDRATLQVNCCTTVRKKSLLKGLQ